MKVAAYIGQPVVMRVDAAGVKVGIVVEKESPTTVLVHCLSKPRGGWAGMHDHPFYELLYLPDGDNSKPGTCFDAQDFSRSLDAPEPAPPMPPQPSAALGKPVTVVVPEVEPAAIVGDVPPGVSGQPALSDGAEGQPTVADLPETTEETAE